MSQPVARQGDLITTTCEHQVQENRPILLLHPSPPLSLIRLMPRSISS